MLDKILVIGATVGLPVGFATTQRVLNLSSGLKHQGYDIEIILPKPSEYQCSGSPNISQSGVIKEIPFFYKSGTPIYKKSKIGRYNQKIYGLFNTLLYINKVRRIEMNSSEHLVILSYTRDLFLILCLAAFCKVFNILFIAEMCEWPLTLPIKSNLSRIRQKLFCNIVPHIIDGAIPISSYIADEMVKRKKDLPIIKVPILIDSKEFGTYIDTAYSESNYLMFSGNLGYRETIDLIIKSFAIVRRSLPEIKLLITGTNDKTIPDWVRKKVDILPLKESIVFTGFLSRDELFSCYSNASALLIPLHDDERSKSRFPTKIGEYLLSGRPVITTNFGEVQNYLKDEITAFVSPNDSSTNFAEAILRSIRNPVLSAEVGARGKDLAIREFDYRKHGKRIHDWIQELAANKKVNPSSK